MHVAAGERERKHSESWPRSLSAGLDSMCMSAAGPVSVGQLTEDMCAKKIVKIVRKMSLYVQRDQNILDFFI